MSKVITAVYIFCLMMSLVFGDNIKNKIEISEIKLLQQDYTIEDSCLTMEWGMIKMCYLFTDEDITIRMQYKFDGSFFFQIGTDSSDLEGSDRDLIEILNPVNKNVLPTVQDSFWEGSIQMNDETLGGKNDIELIDYKIDQESQGKNIRFRASKRNPIVQVTNREQGSDGESQQAEDTYASEFTFKRKLNTGDQYDRVYKQGEVVWIVYYWTSEQYFTSKGLQSGAAQFPFENGYSGYGFMQWPILLYQKIHFWTNFAMWGILIDIANCAARFFKTKKYYMHVHGFLMLLVCLSTFAVEMWTLILNPQLFDRYDELDDVVKFHFLMGFIFMIVFIVHTIGGYILYRMLIKNKTGGKGSQYFKLYHQVFGYILYFFGKAGNITGFKVIQDEWTANVCYVVFSALIGLRIIFEGFFIFYPSIFRKVLFIDAKQKMVKDIEDKKLSLISKEQKLKDIVNKMNDYQLTTKEIINQYEKTHLVIFDNGIYDIKNMYHPGGNFITKKMKGREIGRFMYGAFGLETSNMQGYEHSKYAYEMLEQYYLGDLDNIDLFLPKQDETSFSEWRISKIQKLDNDTNTFFFTGKKSTIKVQKVFQTMEWLGRHFVLNEASMKKTTRQYTNILSYSDYHVELRKQLFANYLALTVNKTNAVNIDSSKLSSLRNDNLFPVVIKKYNSNRGFSQHIHENLDDTYYIRGPYSRGLELSSKSTGEHLFICGGTGILPFHDMLDYMYKYMIYKCVRKLDKKQLVRSSFLNKSIGNGNGLEQSLSEQINVDNEDYDQNVNPDLKIKLFASFMSVSQSFGCLEMLNQMMRLEKENDLQIFSCIVKISKNSDELSQYEYLESTSSQFTKEFIYNNSNLKDTQKIYICGPPILNKSVYNGLTNLGYDESNIMLV